MVWSHKSGVYWRQLLHLKKINLCAISRGIGVMPVVKSTRELLVKCFPTLPFDCPINPKKYEGTFNLTLGK